MDNSDTPRFGTTKLQRQLVRGTDPSEQAIQSHSLIDSLIQEHKRRRFEEFDDLHGSLGVIKSGCFGGFGMPAKRGNLRPRGGFGMTAKRGNLRPRADIGLNWVVHGS